MIRRNPAWSQIITLRQPLPSATQKAKIVNFLVDAYPRESAHQLRELFEERRGRGVDSLHAALVRGLVLIADSTEQDATLRSQLAAEAPKFDELLRRDSAEFVVGLDVLRAMAQSSDSALGRAATSALVRFVNSDTSFSGPSLWRKHAVVRALGSAPYGRGLPALDTLLKTRVVDKVQSKNQAAAAFSDVIREQIVQSAKQASVAVATTNTRADRERFLGTLNRLEVTAPELKVLRRELEQASEASAGCEQSLGGVCAGKDEALRVIAESPASEDGYRDLLSHFSLSTQFRQAADTFEMLKTRHPNTIWPRKILAEIYHESRSLQDTGAFERAYEEMATLRSLDAYTQLRAKSPEDYVRVESDFVEVALSAKRFTQAEGAARGLLADSRVPVDQLNMRLFIYLAAVMKRDANAAAARLADLEGVVASLPANHYNNWVYPGTITFIGRSDLPAPVKRALEKLCKEGQWYTAQQAAAVIGENRTALKSL